MKKVGIVSFFMLICAFSFAQTTYDDVPYGYVDLGLPSGTLWKTYNEPGMYNYNTAVEKFGDCLPTREQLDELVDCDWYWDKRRGGYTVRGYNGNAIFLPVDEKSDENGYYWSSRLFSTNSFPTLAWYLSATPRDVRTKWCRSDYRLSVRLVEAPDKRRVRLAERARVAQERKTAQEERLRKQRELEAERERIRQERFRRENTFLITIEAFEKGYNTEIIVDGRMVGIDECRDSLLVGEHTVICRRKYYQDLRHQINVTKTDTHFVLNEMTPKDAQFRIVTDPSDAQVFVNNQLIGTTPTVITIPMVKENMISIKKDFYDDCTYQLFIKGKDVTLIDVKEDGDDLGKNVKIITKDSVKISLSRGRANCFGKIKVSLLGLFYMPQMLGVDLCADGLTKNGTYKDLLMGGGVTDTGSFFRIGIHWGWPITNTYYRLIPQVGILLGGYFSNSHTVEYTDSMGQSKTYRSGHGSIDFVLGFRVDYAIYKWTILTVTPEIGWSSYQKLFGGVKVGISLFNNPTYKNYTYSF